jgi:predicted phosphodiesterase
MLVRYLSDLHLEFGWHELMSLEEDKDTVLVLAGDIGTVAGRHGGGMEVLGRFLVAASVRFRAVVYVLGNHEFYNDCFDSARIDLYNKIIELGLTNVFLLEDTSIVFDDVAFVGATLWTDYDNGNPVKMVLGGQYLNDFRVILLTDPKTKALRRLAPQDLLDAHTASRKYIFDAVKRYKAEGKKTVVVVHHGVTYQSVHQQYKGDPLNSSFVSSMENDIVDASPNVIIHGHVHTSFDYVVGDTRVLVNPRGYVGHELNKEFDPVARFEI